MSRKASFTIQEAESFLRAIELIEKRRLHLWHTLHKLQILFLIKAMAEVDEREELQAGAVEMEEEEGHTVETCYHIFDPNFQSPPLAHNLFPIVNSYPPPSSTTFHQPKAYLTAPSVNQDSTWYADSGASHHVTAEHANILQLNDSN
ncbi:hypothetical protein PIB30_090375 [Stylosanthes scabra]|uniref:Uncharacterized protein n=1 Tax=Stylosanthes scabra TaxID=79078 RepID=A0ABU6QUW0_9FABA|nr:hypothetical protein [Stylosanthes scabra]